jgi:hypothetical protein
MTASPSRPQQRHAAVVTTTSPLKMTAMPPPPTVSTTTFISKRGVFLLTMTFVTFAAFAVCVLLELARLAPASTAATWSVVGLVPDRVAASLRDLDAPLSTACMWLLLLAAPVTSLAAYSPASVVAQVSPSSSSSVPTPPTKHQPRPPHRDQYFRIFQLVAWTLYAAFVGGCVWAPHRCSGDFRTTLAVLAFLAESLIVSSLLALDRPFSKTPWNHRKERLVVMVHNWNNMLLVVGAVLLAASAEATRQSDVATREHAQSLGHYALSAGMNSVALVVTAVFNTYGLGGVLAPKAGWKFFQPFTGGAQFMVCQAVSWTCFGVGLFIQGLYLLSVVIVELELFVGALALAGSLFLVSEVVMVVSLLVFQSDKATNRDRGCPVTARPSFEQRLHAFADDWLGFFFVGIMANTQWIPSACFVVLFATTTRMDAVRVLFYSLLATLLVFIFVAARSLAIHLYNKDSAYGTRRDVSEYRVTYVVPQLLAMALPLACTHSHYRHGHEATLPLALLSALFYVYVFSYSGRPQVTGARKRMSWVAGRSEVMETVVRYFRGRLLRDAPLDPTQHYIIGFHPHGIMSTSVLWLQFSQQWRDLFPGVHANILTASVLHQIPLARDILQFFGGREVSRQAFARTLEHKESVLLVPGGQAEMLEQRSGCKQVRVYTHHKGFLRLAIEHGTPLVPVLSFKEGETMDNVHAPALQRWCIKKIAFPLPFFPYGRLGLPVPRNTDICIAVGAPIAVERKAQPSQDDIDKVHAQYFGQLQTLFDKYKHDAGCSDYEFVLI